jgi:hypothetical protein
VGSGIERWVKGSQREPRFRGTNGLKRFALVAAKTSTGNINALLKFGEPSRSAIMLHLVIAAH